MSRRHSAKSEPIDLLVLDLSHYDMPVNFVKIKRAGIVGVIYKATQGSSYQDATYDKSRTAAITAGLKWGAYHFGDNSDVGAQATNFMKNSYVHPDELFALDFEDNGSATMSFDQALDFMYLVETSLNRAGQGVIYSGDLLKQQSGGPSYFWSSHRLWLAEYSPTPKLPEMWSNYWLWQFSADGSGPTPHTIDGCNGNVDCNSYVGSAEKLMAEWATGKMSTHQLPSTPLP